MAHFMIICEPFYEMSGFVWRLVCTTFITMNEILRHYNMLDNLHHKVITISPTQSFD